MRSVLLTMLCLASIATADDDGALRSELINGILAEPIVPKSLAYPPVPADPRRSSTSRRGILSRVASAPIVFHRHVISPQDGDSCTFTPSCSEYALQAMRAYGLGGWVMASDRLLRCHTGNWRDYAHVRGRKYDPLIPTEPVEVDASRVVRGGLLSLVPGLGQITAGNWRDGVRALATVGVLAAGSAHYVRQDNPVAATVTGATAAFFYIGNVYGGAIAHGRLGSR